jgi:hypothetical protein
MQKAFVLASKTEIARTACSTYHVRSTDQVAGSNQPRSDREWWLQGSTNDKEVVVMSRNIVSREVKRLPSLMAVLVLIPTLPGCIAAATDVRDYYREMAQNYHAAGEKAKMDSLTLEGEVRMLAKNGDFTRAKRMERELGRVKAWEAKCASREAKFDDAARKTEGIFHLEQPPEKRKPTPNLDETTAAPDDRFVMPPLFEAKDL